MAEQKDMSSPLPRKTLKSQLTAHLPSTKNAGNNPKGYPRSKDKEEATVRWSTSQFSGSVVSDSLRPPWTAACQASLSIANSRSLLKLMSIEPGMPSSHLILCHPLLLPPSIVPASGSFQMSQFFPSGGQSVGVSALASVFPMNIQD